MLALGHTGNLVNTEELAREAGMLAGTVTSDSDLIAELIAAELTALGEGDAAVADVHAVDRGVGDGAGGPGHAGHGVVELEEAVAAVVTRLRGAFSLVLMDETRIIGVRDPHGFRPLCLGRLDGGWVLASESPALDIVGAEFVRELEPGEMVVVDDDGVRSHHPFGPDVPEPRLCLFEFVYFARPDTRLYGQSVHQARIRMGEHLAAQAPADADMVMGVPESGVPAAEGFARASGIPFGQGLVKNRYVGRSFIAPNQEMRARTVHMKLNPLRENVAGKRLVVVDDSIVGARPAQLVRMLRDAGAVVTSGSSPPVTGRASRHRHRRAQRADRPQPRRGIATTSTPTASPPVARPAGRRHGRAGRQLDACFTGDSVEVPVTLRKDVLEDRPVLDADRVVQPALDGSTA